MPDLLLDADGKVAALTASGDLQLSNDETGETLAQRLGVRCRFVRGEYKPDLTQGVPYYESILGRKLDDDALDVTIPAIYRSALATCPGVATVDRAVVTIDAEARSLAVEWQITTDTGHTITSDDFANPFRVEIGG